MHKVRYKCKRCGACCRWAGYVRISEEEANAIAAFLGLDLGDFLDKYTRITADGYDLSLIEREDESCIFITEDNECMIQPVKPKQCRDFPEHWNFPGFERSCKAEKIEEE